MNSLPYHGLVSAPFTPFCKDGSVDYKTIPVQAAHLSANGIKGAFVCGTTGEGASLTMEERKKVAEAWKAAASEDLRIIVHVGHTSIGEARELAAHAEKIGADAIGAAAPYFFKPAHVGELVGCCKEIAAAAPTTPFYYYHIPSMTGVTIPCISFLKTAHREIPTLRGIKYTHEDLMDYLACVQFEEASYDIVFGRDESLAAAMAIGAKGAIGSTYNYLGPVFLKLIAAAEEGDLQSAIAFQSQANTIIQTMITHGGLPAAKSIMKLTGIDLGSVRLPLRNLTQNEISNLRSDLELAKFPLATEKTREGMMSGSPTI